jgi:hypothetical protein
MVRVPWIKLIKLIKIERKQKMQLFQTPSAYVIDNPSEELRCELRKKGIIIHSQYVNGTPRYVLEKTYNILDTIFSKFEIEVIYPPDNWIEPDRLFEFNSGVVIIVGNVVNKLDVTLGQYIRAPYMLMTNDLKVHQLKDLYKPHLNCVHRNKQSHFPWSTDLYHKYQPRLESLSGRFIIQSQELQAESDTFYSTEYESSKEKLVSIQNHYKLNKTYHYVPSKDIAPHFRCQENPQISYRKGPVEESKHDDESYAPMYSNPPVSEEYPTSDYARSLKNLYATSVSTLKENYGKPFISKKLQKEYPIYTQRNLHDHGDFSSDYSRSLQNVYSGAAAAAPREEPIFNCMDLIARIPRLNELEYTFNSDMIFGSERTDDFFKHLEKLANTIMDLGLPMTGNLQATLHRFLNSNKTCASVDELLKIMERAAKLLS